MHSLRDAPGYAEMEDYYDSDYVPNDLIARYNALLQERRRRTEQQFIAATQAHGFVTAHDGLVLTTNSATSGDQNTQSLTNATLLDDSFSQRHPPDHPQHHRQRQQQRLSRSSLRSHQRHSTAAVAGNTNACGGLRQGPRTSVALDAIYAARAVSYGNTSTSTASNDDVKATSSPSPAQRPVSSSASPTPHHTATQKPRTQSRKKVKKTKKRASEQKSDVERKPMQHDLYDSAAEALRQERFFSESKRLGKPFVPSGNSGLDVPTRFMLGDCVKILYRSIVPDWREASPMVVSTAEDLIAVYFSLEKLEKSQVTALLQYMNACLLHNAAIREFHLTKVPEGWDVLTDDGYVLYTFRPPWVKKRVFLPDTVNPLHAHLRDGDN